jgi:hypothetical protein
VRRIDELRKRWNDFLLSEGRLRPGESEEDRRRRTMQPRTIPSVRYASELGPIVARRRVLQSVLLPL